MYKTQCIFIKFFLLPLKSEILSCMNYNALIIKVLKTIFLIIIFSFNLFSQDKEFATKIISDLTSPYFHGRGYSNKGVIRTASYIENTLKKCQVPIVYKQKVIFPVSYIKKIQFIKFDTSFTEIGDDVIVYQNSCSINGTFEVEKVNKDNFNEIASMNFINKFILFDTSITNNSKYAKELKIITRTNPLNAKGYILCKSGKLMQIQSDRTNNWVTLEADVKYINTKTISLSIKSKHHKSYKSSNVIGIIPGLSDTVIAYTAHYDHMGRLNNVYFPGANDNASGVSMVLDIGRELSTSKNKYTVALLFFTGEEVGLIGSEYFVNNPTFELSKIKYLFNLDVIGSGEDGFGVVNGTEFSDLIDLMNKINNEYNLGLSFKLRGKSNNSDHAPFYEKGVKAIFLYAMGKAGGYHHPSDKLENMSLAKYNEIVKLLIKIVNY